MFPHKNNPSSLSEGLELQEGTPESFSFEEQQDLRARDP